jgi:hypothetical protein
MSSTPVFADMDAIVIGVSQDPPDRSKRFVEELSLQYRVLFDEARKTMDAYGVGRALGGLVDNRVTFVIDATGIVRGMAVGVFDAKGHFKFAEKWLVRLEHEYSGRTRHVEEYEREEDDRSAVAAGRVAKVTYGPEGSAPTGGIGGAPRYGVAGNVRSRALSSDGRERIRPSTSKGALGSPQSTPHSPSPRSGGSAGRAGWKGLLGQLSSDDNQPPPLATASAHASPSQKTSSDQASIRSKSSGRKRFNFFARKPPPIPPTYQDLDNVEDVEFGEIDPAAENDEDAIPAVPSLDHSAWSAVTSTDSSLGGTAPRAANMTNEVIMANAKGWTQVPLSNGSHGVAPDSSSSNGSWSKGGSPAAASHSSLPTAASGAPMLPAPVPSSPLRGLGFSVGASSRAPQTPSSSPGPARQRLPSFGSKARSVLSSSSVDEPLPPPPIAKSPPPPQAPRDVPTDVGEEEQLAPAFQEVPRRRPATATSSPGPVSPLISALSQASLQNAAIASARREGRTSERPAHEYSPVGPSKYEPRETGTWNAGGRILEGPRVPMRESSRPSTAPQLVAADPQAFVSPLFAPLRQRQDENRRAAAAAAEADAAAASGAAAMQRSASSSTSGYHTPRNSSIINGATGAQTPRSASSHTSGVHTPEGLARSGSGKAGSSRSQPLTPSTSSSGVNGAQPVSLSPIVDAPTGEWDENAAMRAISPRPTASRKAHAKLPPAPPAPTAALPPPPTLSALATSVTGHDSLEDEQEHTSANSIFSTSPSDSLASAMHDFRRRPSVASVRSTGTFG